MKQPGWEHKEVVDFSVLYPVGVWALIFYNSTGGKMWDLMEPMH